MKFGTRVFLILVVVVVCCCSCKKEPPYRSPAGETSEKITGSILAGGEIELATVPGDYIYRSVQMGRCTYLLKYHILSGTVSTVCQDPFCMHETMTCPFAISDSQLAAIGNVLYYAKEQGLKGVTTETGAGQWGTALSMACGYFGLDLTVYMVRCSYEQKPQRRTVMQVYGAKVIPSPSDTTAIGRKMLAEHPENTSGSLGTAISEAVEVAVNGESTRYVLGSVLNQVVLHQSVIGLESKIAMEKYDRYPDIVIGCAGGGSNLGGLMSPFMRDKLKGVASPRFIAVEPMSCPSLTRGKFAYDFCDTGRVTPLAMMYTLGSGFMPAPSHAGGLRYHGMSPILSQLYHDRYLDEARAVSQVDVFKAATEFAKVEGILPAPESAHAIKVAMDEALKCKQNGEKKVILFGLTGTGYFDMVSYDRYLRGELKDAPPTDESLAASEKELPTV